MDKKEKLENLISDHRSVIHNFCNTIGCKNCPLHINFETNHCRSTELQDEITNIEMEIFAEENKEREKRKNNFENLQILSEAYEVYR